MQTQSPVDRLAPVKSAEIIAKLYRRLVLLVGVQLLFSFVPGTGLLGPRGGLLGALLVLVAAIGLLVALAVTAYQLTSQMGNGLPILWAMAMFFPCINILTLLVLSSKAQTWCRQHGIKVGLLGPTKESIEELRRRLLSSNFD